MRLMPAFLLLFAPLGVSGCHACSSGELRQAGPTPHVRCLAGDPPSGDERRVGEAALGWDGRVLTIDGLPRPTRIAALAGPSPGAAPTPAALKALEAAGPHLVLVLGGLGDDDATATATATALASLARPVLFLAGATDRPERVAAALAAQGDPATVVDVSTLDAVRLGTDILVPVAGAAEGHYALDAESCGYGLADLKQRASRLGEADDGERRWLLAWGAPGGGGPKSVARDTEGVDLGVADLAELARRVGAAGGLFAWPASQLASARDSAGQRVLAHGEVAPDLRLVVPRLAGPPRSRGDGSWVPPSFAVLELRDAGMALLSIEPVAP